MQIKKTAFIAFGFSFFIELSQFYHEPWIDAIRTTFLGALILGHGFSFTDLLAYLAGIIIAFLVDKRLFIST